MRQATYRGAAMLMTVGLSALWVGPSTGQDAKPMKAALRVGTFDSRAVAVAYARSTAFGTKVRRLREQHERAKADGNTVEVKRLEAEGRSGQDRLHQQGFSTASVANILKTIDNKLPGIAQQAGVDLLVSKWDLAYTAADAKLVDVTPWLVQPFEPDQKTLAIIEQLGQHAPVPLEKLKIETHE